MTKTVIIPEDVYLKMRRIQVDLIEVKIERNMQQLADAAFRVGIDDVYNYIINCTPQPTPQPPQTPSAQTLEIEA